MRQFIRHPTNVPFSYRLGDAVSQSREQLKNISHGGLCFVSQSLIEPGSNIQLSISICEPSFKSNGIVVWCKKVAACYEVGVSFMDTKTEYCVRMVEQICQIELYKERVMKEEGRELSDREAALEWIDKNAADFPE